MTVYYCVACGYRFERNCKPETCPYCSKRNTSKEVEDAEEIVSEA